mmetsp:Transcript_16847/g.43804  ORF Transcript_16847/g.43804 Transcript_16847/m.43804 type:complete len:227 (+) Transcript_16847:233-913(+)
MSTSHRVTMMWTKRRSSVPNPFIDLYNSFAMYATGSSAYHRMRLTDLSRSPDSSLLQASSSDLREIFLYCFMTSRSCGTLRRLRMRRKALVSALHHVPSPASKMSFASFLHFAMTTGDVHVARFACDRPIRSFMAGPFISDVIFSSSVLPVISWKDAEMALSSSLSRLTRMWMITSSSYPRPLNAFIMTWASRSAGARHIAMSTRCVLRDELASMTSIRSLPHIVL